MAEIASPVVVGAIIGVVMLAMMMAIVIAIMMARSLLVVIILMSIYSLASAVWLLTMDAADVSFTEAVVGAGVSTLIALGAILLTRSEAKTISWKRQIAPSLVALAAGGLLVYAAFDLPSPGDAASPANAYLGRLYVSQASRDIGSANVVTAILSSYRSFDTLGETTVIFAAGIGVALMLGFGERALQDMPRAAFGPAPGGEDVSDHHTVLQVAAKLLIPLMSIYAFYVQFHGDLSPGGGFQAGVIMAVAIILHALVFGLHDTMAAIPPHLTRGFAAGGVLIYAGVGLANLVNGGGFLDYDHLLPRRIEARLPDSALAGGHHLWGQHFGILGVELGIFLTVAATMVTIFYGFAGRMADPVEPSHAGGD